MRSIEVNFVNIFPGKEKKDEEKDGTTAAPQRKRRWGSTKSHDSTKKKPNVNINTNVLKASFAYTSSHVWKTLFATLHC